MRKGDKLYKRWSRSGGPYDQSRFIEYKHLVRRVSDRAYGKYFGDILGLNNNQEDQNGESPRSLFTAQAFQAGLQWHCSLEEESRVRLFADDTAMYLSISSATEGQVPQTDMACLEQWEKMWDMQFNPSKCQILHNTRKV